VMHLPRSADASEIKKQCQFGRGSFCRGKCTVLNGHSAFRHPQITSLRCCITQTPAIQPPARIISTLLTKPTTYSPLIPPAPDTSALAWDGQRPRRKRPLAFHGEMPRCCGKQGTELITLGVRPRLERELAEEKQGMTE
jgi:hypothetical protein